MRRNVYVCLCNSFYVYSRTQTNYSQQHITGTRTSSAAANGGSGYETTLYVQKYGFPYPNSIKLKSGWDFVPESTGGTSNAPCCHGMGQPPSRNLHVYMNILIRPLPPPPKILDMPRTAYGVDKNLDRTLPFCHPLCNKINRVFVGQTIGQSSCFEIKQSQYSCLVHRIKMSCVGRK